MYYCEIHSQTYRPTVEVFFYSALETD